MSDELRFDERVVAVTGAGRGIGREYALMLARRGAAVVVNDASIAMDGLTVEDLSPCDAVVEEIRAMGGKAIANNCDVTDPAGGASIIEDAVQAFGRIDAVINNAGVVGHSSFEDCSIAERDANMAVHYHGHWNVCKAAWPHMKRQRYGRIVNIISGTAYIGGKNRIAYSAAKSSLIGFTRTLALEGEEHGILSNGLGPAGFTRMTSSSFDEWGTKLTDGTPEGKEAWLNRFMNPRHPAVGVTFLAHEACKANGLFFNCFAGRMSRTFIAEADGFFTDDTHFTPEAVRDHWDKINQLEPYVLLNDPAEATAYVSKLVSGGKS